MNDRFVRACRRQPVDRPPVWIMRQAGRYLPEYRALRERADFLTVCRTPELAIEASLQPLRRFPLDAAIVFSDILVPLYAAGVEMTFDPGPRLARPLRTAAEVEALRPGPMAEAAAYVGQAVAGLRRELAGRAAVIGFAGAPWTLAAYLTQGGGHDGFPAVRTMLRRDPETLEKLLGKLADLVADHLAMQFRAGADAVQLFDSWAGLLSPPDYRRFALPALQRVLEALPRERGPVIHFAPAAPHLLEDAARLPVDVLGVCWRVPLHDARRRTGDCFALQGNLDPCALLAPPAAAREAVRGVLESYGPGPGHVMNLGHGILPETPIESVEVLLETVHEFRPAMHEAPVPAGGGSPEESP